MRQVDHIKISLILCCFGLFLSGCEGAIERRVSVTGTVHVDQDKLERGFITFVHVDNPNVVEGAKVENGVFECDLLIGEKIVRCSGAKVVGTYAPDPLLPDNIKDKLEELPESAFDKEIKVNVKQTGDYFVIQYGNAPTNETKVRYEQPTGVVEPSDDQSYKDLLPEL